MNKRNKDDMQRAVTFFRQAIAREPRFADAHAALGGTWAHMYFNGQSLGALPGARKEISTALRLDPGNFEATAIEGKIAISGWNWAEAGSVLRGALGRNPNSAEAQHTYALFLSSLNLQDAAIGHWRRAAALDPLAPLYRANIGSAFHGLNRNAAGIAEEQAALTLDPNFTFAQLQLCQLFADSGKLDEAGKILRDRLVGADGTDGADTDSCRLFIASRSGDGRELARLAHLTERAYAAGDVPASSVGWAYALGMDVGDAIRWFEKAYDARDVQMLDLITDPDFPSKITSDLRWRALMQRPLLKEWQAAHDRAAAALAANI